MIGLNRVTPEPLLLAASLALAGYLAPLALQSGEFVETRAYALGLGALLGFILVTKITALPLLATLFFLRTWQLRRAAAKAGALAALILTVPIAIHYLQMAKWFVRLFIHSDSYGSGRVGLPSTLRLWQGFISLLGLTPEIFIMLGFYAVLFWLWRGSTRRVIAISMLILSASILMVLKEPAPRYFMPVIGSIALANAAIVSRLPTQRGTARIGAALLILMLVLGIWRNALATSAWAQSAEQTQSDNQKLIAATVMGGRQPVFFHDVNTPLYNLSFGEEHTVRHFSSELKRLYPGALFYNVFGHRFESFTGLLSAKEARLRLVVDRCFRLISSPVERYGDFGIPRTELSLVARTDHGLADSVAVYAWRPR